MRILFRFDKNNIFIYFYVKNKKLLNCFEISSKFINRNLIIDKQNVGIYDEFEIFAILISMSDFLPNLKSIFNKHIEIKPFQGNIFVFKKILLLIFHHIYIITIIFFI